MHEEPAQILRDASGEIVATGPASADAHSIARAERQSLPAMNAVSEAEKEAAFVERAKAGRF